MTDTLVQAMRDKAAELTAERDKTVDEGRKSSRWDQLNRCVVGLALTADWVEEL